MSSWKNNMFVLHSWAVFLMAEMVLLWFFSPPKSELPVIWLEYLFWPIWIYAMVLIGVPFFLFKKKGGVKDGDGYEKTTKLVNEGVFKYIRHPQYTGGIWIAIAMVLPNQSWLILLFSVFSIASYALTIRLEEEKLTEKFGDEYREYKKETSSCSFLVSLYKKSQIA